jgi:tripartite-type tricarboxylate transporter receptor subunit TctC
LLTRVSLRCTSSGTHSTRRFRGRPPSTWRGSAAGLADLRAGRIAFLFATPSVVGEHIRSGEISGLAVMPDARIPTLPDVPTMKEAGFPGVNNLEP